MSELARTAGVVGCAGLALLLVAGRRDLRLLGLALWAAGLAGLAAYLAPDGRALVLVAAGAAAAVLVAPAAWALLRLPWLLAVATVACLPVRIPVEIGAEEANLLLPLYGVVGGLAVAVGWQLVRGDERARELGPLAFPLAAFVAWSGVTVLWSDDLREGAITLGAFVLPFGLLALGFARLPWRGRWLTWLWGALVASALLYALVGAAQWWTRDVFWNPKVVVGNAYAPFFRVNSVFWDPSIYGRYLVLALLATVAGILLARRDGLRIAALYLVAVATWIGLLLSYSQSSFVALAAGLAVAAVVVWRLRAAVALAALAAVLAATAFGVPQLRTEIVDKARSGLDDVTSGRASLVGQGVRIAADHPALGVGLGGFKRAYADRLGLRGADPKRAASHTSPVTVAVEQGVPGLVLLLWLLGTALVATLGGLGRGFTSRVSLAVGLAILAVAVHSLFYGALVEDPATWGLLGLAALVARVPRKPPAAEASA